MSRKFKQAGISEEVIQQLRTENITTCHDLLYTSSVQLMGCLNLNLPHIEKIISKVSSVSCPTPVTATELVNQTNPLKLTLPKLDEVLHGGIPAGMITEIVGPSGCGKTQFCLMLAVNAALPAENGGTGGGVLYLDTEGAFTARRIAEIFSTRYPDICTTEEQLKSLCTKILVCNVLTSTELSKILDSLECTIIKNRIRLVIVDSIACLVRNEFGGDRSMEKSAYLGKQAATIKALAENFNIPVFVTNQITTKFVSPSSPASPVPTDEDPQDNEVRSSEMVGYCTAALGNTWSHCVNVRLIVQYVDNSRRQIIISKSPMSPSMCFSYTIQDKGIVLLDDGFFCEPGLDRIRTRTHYEH